MTTFMNRLMFLCGYISIKEHERLMLNQVKNMKTEKPPVMGGMGVPTLGELFKTMAAGHDRRFWERNNTYVLSTCMTCDQHAINVVFSKPIESVETLKLLLECFPGVEEVDIDKDKDLVVFLEEKCNVEEKAKELKIKLDEYFK